jgi:hypothetical protein
MKCKRVDYENNTKLQTMGVGNAAVRLGVRAKTIVKWRLELGLPTNSDPRHHRVMAVKRSIEANVDHDIVDGQCTLTLQDLKKKYGVSVDTISRLLAEMGVKKLRTLVVRSPDERRRQLEPESIFIAHQHESWLRPDGMSEHTAPLIQAKRRAYGAH